MDASYEYIICVKPYRDSPGIEYLKNKTYRFGGEKYIVFTREEDATRYSSENRARAAYKKFSESCCNLSDLREKDVHFERVEKERKKEEDK